MQELIELDARIRKLRQREDYLWEIGSGANWMGYHISAMLALHDHFTSLSWNPVTQFLVFDQPSQVYFPNKLGKERDYKSEDIIRVQKIFSVFQTRIKLRQYATQIIVIEHADEDAWGLPEEEIHIVARWRNNTSDALIPKE